MNVKLIMTTQITSVAPTDSLASLAELFGKALYHHLPVVVDGRLVGIISDRDLLRNVGALLHNKGHVQADTSLSLSSIAEQIMSCNVVTVDETTSIDCASILLLENNISCLPVVDAEQVLLGILTWKDILRFHVYYSDSLPMIDDLTTLPLVISAADKT